MGTYVVVLPSPILDCQSSLSQSPELFTVEAFFSKTSFETLHISPAAAEPGASRLDIDCLYPLFGKSAAKPAFDELQAVVALDVIVEAYETY